MSLLINDNNYVTEYKEADIFTKQQQDIFWTPHEIEMEKDLHDLKTKLTTQELHGVTTVLKLFTMYELEVGENYWGGFIRDTFPRHEVQAMSSSFATVELAVHAKFYRKINEVLGIDTDNFYSGYAKDKTLKDRMDWIGRQFKDKDPLYITAIGSIAEGAILYSNFAFLKHFQAEGKNKLMNMTAGINFSVRDENLHSEAGAWLHRELKEEMNVSDKDYQKLVVKIKKTCEQIYEHECRIIDMIFEQGDIKGITAKQMKNFIQSRLNICLSQLDIKPMYNVEYDPISSWFYKNINSGSLHDFFAKQGNNYSRDWVEGKFAW